MIKQAEKKIKGRNIYNIDFINSWFLNYEHKAEQTDLIISKVAFHHLPDL